ncbi:hypothetical protein CPB86DRAFT_811790 [Serendipita vermifera]|nr:hypothetical protein CPB86DRAFT_811790 [Serendipita vermifera]
MSNLREVSLELKRLKDQEDEKWEIGQQTEKCLTEAIEVYNRAKAELERASEARQKAIQAEKDAKAEWWKTRSLRDKKEQEWNKLLEDHLVPSRPTFPSRCTACVGSMTTAKSITGVVNPFYMEPLPTMRLPLRIAPPASSKPLKIDNDSRGDKSHGQNEVRELQNKELERLRDEERKAKSSASSASHSLKFAKLAYKRALNELNKALEDHEKALGANEEASRREERATEKEG